MKERKREKMPSGNDANKKTGTRKGEGKRRGICECGGAEKNARLWTQSYRMFCATSNSPDSKNVAVVVVL
jgi:hypothetical protein